MASRPSSSTGPLRGGGREPVVARVIDVSTRETIFGPPANDNNRPARHRLAPLFGPAVALALALGGVAYLTLG